MATWRSKEQVSDIMRKVRSQDTTPEMTFRRALWAKDVRYRLHDSGLPGKPDIVIPRGKLVVFIDGDYWHGNQWQMRGYPSLQAQFVASPKAEYWIGKISGNMRRDRQNSAGLLSKGWRILRFWESDVVTSLDQCIQTTLEAIQYKGKTTSASRLAEHTVAEFFAGIGLVRRAFEKKGWRVVFANDIDQEKFRMYEANFPAAGVHFLLGDIHKLPATVVPDVSIATASFPCNDLSLAGGMKGISGDNSGAFWGFMRVLEEMEDRRPPLILLENVTGWLHSGKGQDFADSLIRLNRVGYACDAFILNALDFVPQSRQRLFVVGILDSLRHGCVRELRESYQSKLRPKRLADFIHSHPEIDWSIRHLPTPERHRVRLESIIEDLPNDSPEWWNQERAEYFFHQLSERHTRIAQEMIAGDQFSYGTAFRRVRHGRSMAELRADGIAGCLRTPRGGSGRQILFKAGNGEYRVRLLTPRECARLQGVDDDYVINVPLNQALFGFGDAVCIPVVEWIIDHYISPVVTSAIHGTVLYPHAMEI